ncbi:gluconokinase [Variovorax sp. KK3]|uniref:gluconokinase n=1 Tax=Variovorax sp. KK3 TaxID=1855728 RepID=UPI00097BE4D5|nr:gluconokinase [Variovorax sp. KK3]
MQEVYFSSSTDRPLRLVVMGVSGCGKSSLGSALADALGLPLVEGDDFHSPESVSKMRAGTALTDADRAGWLDRLGQELAAAQQGVVLSCSALKRDYRDRLRAAAPGLRFVFMELTRDEAERRVGSRAAHFFAASLVDNQFATLESPVGEPGVLAVDATAPMPELVTKVQAWLAAEAPAGA